jgi:hypothetical protein
MTNGRFLIIPASGQPIKADAWIEEAGTDTVTITRHPVEQGAQITDHAIVEPARVNLRLGWSNSSPRALSTSYIDEVYAQLLALKDARLPFKLVTAKRSYENMLIAALTQVTDERTAHALFVSVTIEQIIIVQTQVTSIGTDPSVMANPESNQPVANLGQKQATPTTLFNRNAPGVQDQIGP